MLVGAATAFPIAWFYGKAELGPLLLVGSLTSLFSGFSRPGAMLCERDRKMVRVAIFRIGVALIGFISVDHADRHGHRYRKRCGICAGCRS